MSQLISTFVRGYNNSVAINARAKLNFKWFQLAEWSSRKNNSRTSVQTQVSSFPPDKFQVNSLYISMAVVHLNHSLDAFALLSMTLVQVASIVLAWPRYHQSDHFKSGETWQFSCAVGLASFLSERWGGMKLAPWVSWNGTSKDEMSSPLGNCQKTFDAVAMLVCEGHSGKCGKYK